MPFPISALLRRSLCALVVSTSLLVAAAFAASSGPPVVIQWLKIKFRSVHSCANTPSMTSIPAARITALYRRIFARLPDATERSLSQTYLGRTPTEAQWAQFAQALLLSNEFFYCD